MDKANYTTTWSVQDVLQHVPQLGIPHFQRGLVWGTETRAALLESLFYDTPCGSFVLWVPKEGAVQGVPLDPSLCTETKYLVIDGQQRIRSLHAVFNGREDSDEGGEEANATDDSEEGAQKVWCINLTRVAGFAEKLETPAREYSLFIKTMDPKERKARNQASPLLFNLLPLRVVQTVESWTDPAMDSYRALLKVLDTDDTAVAAYLEQQYRTLRETVLSMQDRHFFVSVQRKDNPAEMADLYNRINAGGKRVEIEERAFARLVGLKSDTYDELARVFEAVHGPISIGRKDTEKQGRDQVLRRQQERAFGFKLFILVFLQVCQHHLGFRQSKSEYSFDLINKSNFLAQFRKLESEQVAFLWRETRRVLAHVRDVLRTELFCDDLRTLPEAKSLTPVFQLLIHYPALSEERYRPLLAALSLRLLLAELDSKSLLAILNDAGDPGHVAFDVIPTMLQALDKATERGKLAARLEQSNSLQHRYVWLLYWLERHKGARDFLYANVPPEHKLIPPEPLIGRDALPEKQHLVAFNKAGPMYPGGFSRSASHAVNSIGNLTYISHALNTFDGGLGQFLADLAAEPEENRSAHFLVDEQTGQRVIEDYNRLRERLNPKNSTATEKDRETFERMMRHRRQIIREGFLGWIAELDRTAAAQLGIAGLAELKSLSRSETRIEPAAPQFAPLQLQHVAHLIRKLGLGHTDEDRIVYLARHAARIPARKDDRLDRDLWLTKKKKRVWVAAKAGRVALMFSPEVSQEHRQDIADALLLDATDESIPDVVELRPVPDFTELLDLIKELGPEIEAPSGTSGRRQEERHQFWTGFSEYLKQQPDAPFQLENPWRKGTTRFLRIGENGVLKGKISVVHGNVEIYLRLKGPGAAQIFEELLKQRESIEKAIGAELQWQVKKSQIGLELESAGTTDADRAEQFEWLHQMAKLFIDVLGSRLKAASE